MRTASLWVVFAVLLTGSLAVSYWKYSRGTGGEPVAVVERPAPVRHAVPAGRYPLSPAAGTPLPPLGESDGAVSAMLAALFGGQGLDRIVISDRFIERFVLLVDNLPRRQLPVGRLPAAPAPGTFLVEGGEGSEIVSPANYRRYERYVRLAEVVDTGRLVTAYVRHYPLFQQAYEQLGYPDAYFNDRLIEVIDHLLAAPEVGEPVRLIRPKVRYAFNDPKLEALSAGEKIMIRIGSGNAAKVKAKLGEIRRELTAVAPGG